MDSMTPEQNEQWRQALHPMLSRLTGEGWDVECTLLALLPAQEQKQRRIELYGQERLLKAWQVPSWARDLRYTIFLSFIDGTESWIPRFGLRSAAGLIGIRICHPAETDLEACYQRFFVRYIQESLRPFVEWAGQGDAQRRSCYSPIVTLFNACEGFLQERSVELFRHLWKHLQGVGDMQSTSEQDAVYRLANNATVGILALRSLGQPEFSGDPTTWNPTYLPPNLNVLHVLRHRHGHYESGLFPVGRPAEDDGRVYFHDLMAAAYLTALEAECQPPDWLPGV